MCEETLLNLNLSTKRELIMSPDGRQPTFRQIGGSREPSVFRGSTSETEFTWVLENGITVTIDRLAGDYKMKDPNTPRRWVGKCKPTNKLF